MTIYLPLQHGVESSEKIDLLCSLTSFREVMKQAIQLYYANGWSVEFICTGDILRPNNVHAALTTLDTVNRTVHGIKYCTNPSDRVAAILQLISFRFEMRDIIHQHIAHHIPEPDVCEKHKISVSNLRKAVKNYRKTEKIVDTLISMN